LVYSEGFWKSKRGIPDIFNVRGAEKKNDQYVPMSPELFQNIDTQQLEFAPSLSADGLELYFSKINVVANLPFYKGIYVSKRDSLDQPFGKPEKVAAITGTVEAPSLSADEKFLFYHRKVEGTFKAHRVRRKSN